MAAASEYSFGPYRFDATGRVLFRGAENVDLPPKAAETLLILLAHAGEVVDKDTLLDSVWARTVVGEGSLTRTISILRKALGGDASSSAYITTISKRGYRFAATVSRGATDAESSREPHRDNTRLLERQVQLEVLRSLLREAGARSGKLAFVRGEAGAGKSALVEHFARESGQAAPVVWGHSDALQTSRVLGPVNEVVAGLSLLDDKALEPEITRQQLFARLLEQLSPPYPLKIVVLEDLHWADEATLDFVRFLGQRIQHTHCLLIATYRDDELAMTHPLRSVLGELTGQHVTRIYVPALSLHAVEQLAAGTGRDARLVHHLTGGNPFFVREHLVAPAGSMPETVRDAVMVRLLRCSTAARQLAEFMSLVPGRTEAWLTRAALGDTAAAADEAVDRGLLRHHDEALAFRHELGRLAVESALPLAHARALHEQILAVLEEHDADLSRLVHHASRAGDEKRLLKYAPLAARQAARAGAHREAAAHLATALRHAGSLDAPQRAALLEFHAGECIFTNDDTAALDSATEALALWRQAGDVGAQARTLLVRRWPYWKSGQGALAGQQVAEAIALLETLPPGRILASAYSARSQWAMRGARLEEALDFGQRALTLAEQFDDHGARSNALNNMGAARLKAGDEAGLTQLEQSLAIALEHHLHEDAGRAYSNLVSALVDMHRPDLAERFVADGVAFAELHDHRHSLYYIRAYAANLELDLGRWESAARASAELLEIPSLVTTQRIPSLVARATVGVRRGEPGMDKLLDEASRLAKTTGEPQRIGRVAALRAESAWYRGDLHAVSDEAATTLRTAERSRELWTYSRLAYWGHRADRGLVLPAQIAEPYRLMIEGNWERAAAAFQGVRMPYERALALADGPESALRESLRILEELGAGPLTTIVRKRLCAS